MLGEKMKVVFFNVDKEDQITSLSDNRKNYEIIWAMMESVRLAMPDADIVQLSDNESAIIENVDEIYRCGPKPKYLMPARMKYQYEYLKHHCPYGENVIFIDPDIIVQHDLSDVFDDNFDVGLTWRDNLGQLSEQMPFNAGVVFCVNKMASKLFFLTAYNMIEHGIENVKQWYGDQLAMIDIVGRENYKNRTSDYIETKDIVFKMFPCASYNYSPVGEEILRVLHPSENCKTFDRLKTKHVLHFKGGLKDHMTSYWEKLY